MYKVTVLNPCSCFVKKGFGEVQEFDTKEDAAYEANKMLEVMNRTFCKRHEFSMTEKFGDYKIYTKSSS